MKKRILALTLALLLLLTSCGGGTSATTIHLRKTEGTVGVSDADGKAVDPQEDLGLYSGYGVNTSSESYAWIDLDEAKLTKMDQNSEIAITKEGKNLELEVKSGSLFFNVTEPLAEDETLNIRSSTMAVGIQDSCGWVVGSGEKGAQVFLLAGAVEAEPAGAGETVRITAGNMAEVTVNESGETGLTVRPFSEEYIAPFVLTELENDTALSAAILEASGLDALNPPDPAQRLRGAYQEIVAQQTVYDHYAAAGSSYTANGINYSADAGLSDAFLWDLDGDGTQELVMIYRFYELSEWALYHDFYNAAPIQKIVVYGQSMGQPVLLDTIDATKLNDDFYYTNHYRLIEDGTGQAIQLYTNKAEGGVVFGNIWSFSFENGVFSLLENHNEPQQADLDWLSSAYEDETDLENLCPAFPDDIRRKQALLSAFVSYDLYTDGNTCIQARLTDINQDGEDELFMLMERSYDEERRSHDGLRAEYYTWDGANLDRTVLAAEPGDIVYGKVIDMDQDGEDELLLIMDDGTALAYSWKGASWERTLLSEYAGIYTGLYRDTATGDIYLCGTLHLLENMGGFESSEFIGLSDSFSYSVSAEEVFSVYGCSSLDELTPDELEEGDARLNEAWAEYDRNLERFELIEYIPDLYGGDYNESSFEFYAQLQPTIDEVRQWLMAR